MKIIKFFPLLLLVVLLSTGCVIGVTTSPTGKGGGVFVSENAGTDWVNTSRLLSVDETNNFLGAQITAMVFDPQVSSTIYVGTLKQGIFFTLDGGRSWSQTLSNIDTIYDVAVHPNDKCHIFAATGDRLYRSLDCARSWQSILFETRPDEVLSQLAIDSSVNPVLYAGSNMGSMYRSFDQGDTWQSLAFFDSGVADIIISPDNNSKIYVGLKKDGIVRSVDAGSNWVNITDAIRANYSGFDNFHKLVISEIDDSLIYANDYSIAISKNNGSTWQLLNLLTPPKSVYIYGLAVSNLDSNVIYYTSHDTIYKTIDGGDNWSTTRMPTSKVLSSLLITPTNNNLIFGGAINKIK